MKTNSSAVSKEIRSGKSLERELAAATKLFYGKETESNWEVREQTLHMLVSFLHHDKFQNWKDTFLQGIHHLVFGIADATQSLRTKYALVAFDLITTIGQVLGTQLDATTFETLFTGLLQCVHSSKQIIANKAKEAMISFISTTSYHSKAITLLCLALDDRNPQSRHLAALYMDVYLQKHAPNALVRENMGGSLNILKKLELFLKTGLVDATPAVRQVCCGTFWIYHKYWPSNGDRLLDSFDTTTKRRLEKAKSSSTSSRGQSSILGKRPRLTTNDRHQSLATRKRSSSSKGAHPPSLIPTLTPALASASLLHMLRSSDTTLNCEGLCILAKRLFMHLQSSSSSSSSSSLSCEMVVLPSSVPRRADLIPILLDYLSPQRMQSDTKMCNHLMSWDCLSGVFVHIFSLHQFLPSIILAGQRHYRDHGKPKQQPKEHHSICTLGLLRLKLYLKYNDKMLMKYLLDILLMTTTYGGAGLRDPNAKCELETTQGTHEDLVYGLVTWMDELVCGYIGLNDDDSENRLANGCTQPWAQDVFSSLGVATQWFADKDHLESCLESVLRLLKSYSSTTSSAVFTSLITLVGRLRLVNARVFDKVLDQSEEDVCRLLDTCLGRWRSTVGDGHRRGTALRDTTIICQMDSDTDDDPPPAYDDIALSSPPFWTQQHISSSASSSPSQDIGLEEGTLLDGEDTCDVWDVRLDGIMSEDSSFISTYDTLEAYGDLSATTHTDRMDPSLEVINSTTDNDTNSTFTEPRIETTDNNVTTKQDGGESDQDVLVGAIYQLVTTTSDNRLCTLERLERLCERYSTKDEGIDGRNGQLWKFTYKLGARDGSLLELLIGQLTTYLQQRSQHQHHIMAMLRLLKQLVVHHGNLIHHENDTLILTMAKALIDTKVEKYGRIPSLVDQTQDLLLESLSIESWVTLTVQLLKHYFGPGNHSPQALPTVFKMVEKLAPKLTSAGDIMQRCASTFEQGINHPTLSIRLSCVNALVELATSGQCDVKEYLPNLRKEQENLLDHYIRQRSTEK